MLTWVVADSLSAAGALEAAAAVAAAFFAMATTCGQVAEQMEIELQTVIGGML